jgi:hypothetical protein
LEIGQMARSIPALAPPRDLWDGVAARIEAPVIQLAPTTGEQRAARRRRNSLRLGAAAAAIVAVTATSTYTITRAMYAPEAVPVAVAPAQPSFDSPPVDSYYFQSPQAMGGAMLVSNQRGDDPYEREVAQLRALFDQRRPLLDTAIVALLERNLKMIDRAIGQSRAALARDPGNALLHRQLNLAMGKKIQVLRTAATLPAAAE